MLVWLLGMLLSAAALIGMVLALLYASKNGGSVLEWMRRALVPALCPVAMAALAIDCRKLGRKTPQGKALKRRLMIASFALFLALEIVFLIHTRPARIWTMIADFSCSWSAGRPRLSIPFSAARSAAGRAKGG